jgi:hypothetical protein
VLLPYLNADWEAGNHRRIGERIGQVLVSMSLGYIALSAAAMAAAPWLYQYAFQGKYDLALEVLPLTLLQVTWVSLYLYVSRTCCARYIDLATATSGGAIERRYHRALFQHDLHSGWATSAQDIKKLGLVIPVNHPKCDESRLHEIEIVDYWGSRGTQKSILAD